jgi:hypothetical protein
MSFGCTNIVGHNHLAAGQLNIRREINRIELAGKVKKYES